MTDIIQRIVEAQKVLEDELATTTIEENRKEFINERLLKIIHHAPDFTKPVDLNRVQEEVIKPLSEAMIEDEYFDTCLKYKVTDGDYCETMVTWLADFVIISDIYMDSALTVKAMYAWLTCCENPNDSIKLEYIESDGDGEPGETNVTIKVLRDRNTFCVTCEDPKMLHPLFQDLIVPALNALCNIVNDALSDEDKDKSESDKDNWIGFDEFFKDVNNLNSFKNDLSTYSHEIYNCWHDAFTKIYEDQNNMLQSLNKAFKGSESNDGTLEDNKEDAIQHAKEIFNKDFGTGASDKDNEYRCCECKDCNNKKDQRSNNNDEFNKAIARYMVNRFGLKKDEAKYIAETFDMRDDDDVSIVVTIIEKGFGWKSKINNYIKKYENDESKYHQITYLKGFTLVDGGGKANHEYYSQSLRAATRIKQVKDTSIVAVETLRDVTKSRRFLSNINITYIEGHSCTCDTNFAQYVIDACNKFLRDFKNDSYRAEKWFYETLTIPCNIYIQNENVNINRQPLIVTDPKNGSRVVPNSHMIKYLEEYVQVIADTLNVITASRQVLNKLGSK